MEIVEIKENKNNIVVKHQELVRTARYRLSELGIKVVSILISMIKMSDEDFKEYLIHINDFKELIGSTSKNTYEYVDVMTDELMKKPFKIGDEKFNWVYYARYKEGDNAVVMKIAPELKPYLLALKKNFLEYHISNILSLRSGYVIRLYELCKDRLSEVTRYRENKSVVFELKIDYLRELFEVPESFRYNDIKRNIIDKAVTQFKAKTDIQFSYVEQKIGRKVDRIIITVKENSKGSSDFMRDRISFISHIRKNYINQDILGTIDKYTQKPALISVAPDGKLYNKKSTAGYSKERADEIWTSLYELASDGKLYSIQPSLFEADEQKIPIENWILSADILRPAGEETDEKYVDEILDFWGDFKDENSYKNLEPQTQFYWDNLFLAWLKSS